MFEKVKTPVCCQSDASGSHSDSSVSQSDASVMSLFSSTIKSEM